MGSYKLEWKPSVHNDFKKINKYQISKILQKAQELSHNPYPPGFKKLKDSSESYRIRVGDYRLIYQVDKKEKIITVQMVRHRKDIYQKR